MQIQQNISLKRYNTFGIDARAHFFSAFRSIDDLLEVLTHIAWPELMILGGGSNILFTKYLQ